MKILKLEQNTPEWHLFRREHIGASDCPIVMGKSPYKNPLQLWEEKITGKSGYQSNAMKRGSELEATVRDWYSSSYEKIEPAVIQSSENDFMIASIDGMSKDKKTIVEIKCPGEKVYDEIKHGKIPEYYKWQIQHQLAVSGGDGCVLLVYNGTDDPLHFVIESDLEMQEKLIDEEKAFYQSMLEFTPPKGSDIPIQRDDKDWRQAAKAWIDAKAVLDASIEHEAICRDALKYLCENKPCEGAGITVKRYFAKGAVDYAKIPELKGVDVELYRKAISERWKITPTV